MWAAVAFLPDYSGQALALTRLLVADSASRELGSTVARNATTGRVAPISWLAGFTAETSSTRLARALACFQVTLLRLGSQATVTGTAALAAAEAPVIWSTLVAVFSNHIVVTVASSCSCIARVHSTRVARALSAILSHDGITIEARCTKFTSWARSVVQAKHTFASNCVTGCRVFRVNVATALAWLAAAAYRIWHTEVASITHIASSPKVSFFAVAADLLTTWRNLTAFSKVV